MVLDLIMQQINVYTRTIRLVTMRPNYLWENTAYELDDITAYEVPI